MSMRMREREKRLVVRLVVWVEVVGRPFPLVALSLSPEERGAGVGVRERPASRMRGTRERESLPRTAASCEGLCSLVFSLEGITRTSHRNRVEKERDRRLK